MILFQNSKKFIEYNYKIEDELENDIVDSH